MGFDLEAVSRNRLSVGGSAWAFLLNLAEAYGWQPAGTGPPAGVDSLAWDGRYDSNDGEEVSADDATALGAALRRASLDPDMSVVGARVARDLAKHVREEFQRLTGDDLPAEEAEAEFASDAGDIEALIHFCSLGSFTIS